MSHLSQAICAHLCIPRRATNGRLNRKRESEREGVREGGKEGRKKAVVNVCSLPQDSPMCELCN